jgi:pimeloyl-ACP methyl ester carboxylesterase
MHFARLLPIGVLVATVSAAAGGAAPPPEQFVTVNGVRLQYLDWGGHGDVLLFLSSFGATSHEFDSLARHFVDQFHVLGVTRRGQGLSDKPPSGYDTRTLVEDIRAFLDAKGIRRATLVGYSVAGREETLFAATDPERIIKLVYLDATGDPKSAYELATNPATAYPLGIEEPDAALGEISRGAREADADYTKVAAPALAFCVIYESTFVPPDADAALRERLLTRYEKYGRPFEAQQREHFRRDMRNGRIVELRHTSHGTFINDPRQQAIVVREMRRFLSTR